METVRDLGRVEPWQESLERSRARRGRPPHASIEPSRPRLERQLVRSAAHASAADRLSPRRATAKRSRKLAVSSWGILALVVLAAGLPSVFNGRGAQASPTAARADAFRQRAASLHADSGGVAPGSRGYVAHAARTCQAVAGSSGYVNPLAGAVVTGERIDQGVDYAGSGTLTAIGAAKITYVATSGTGWPGAFIEYRLLGGPDAGCLVYYAEGVSPTAGLRAGETVHAGQAMATIIPGWATGVELGWGAGISTKTYAATTGTWTARDDANSIASAAGKSFSALIVSLGGPAGKVEG